MNIQQYELADGTKKWVLKGAYIGTDVITGKQIRSTIRGRTQREVRQKLALKIREFEDNDGTKIAKVKIKNCNELIDLYLEHYKESGIKIATYNQISKKINKHIRPLIGDIKLDKLSHTLIDIQVTEFKKQIKNKLKNYNTELAYMKAIFKFAVGKEYLKSNPMANISTSKDKKDKSSSAEKQIRYYQKSQINGIINTLELKLKTNSIHYLAFVTYIKILLLTGARPSEQLALNWSDIDFKNSTMNIAKTISDNGRIVGTPKSDAGFRKITLDDLAIVTLKQWQQSLYDRCLALGIKKPNTVFYNVVKDKYYLYDTMLDWYNDFCIENDIPYLGGLHCFRHTHATMYVASGGDFKTLQARLGHEDISMTMNLYADALPEIERKATENAINFMFSERS